MNREVLSISQRMSLRKPQEDALDILSRLCDVLPLEKGSDLSDCLTKVRSCNGLSQFENFEHDFPSICFSLGTGVGKTRLAGAFITYLYLVEGIRNFFVLAPSLTIYEKLKADFTPNTAKYAFRGVPEFASNPPVLVTGENYESGKGVASGQVRDVLDTVYVNVFNISKINSEIRGGKAPRIKAFREYIGDSYFNYLSSLDDLVLIMDESHRYRAEAGMRAINELNPILGLELTATPQIETGSKTIPFKNVVYGYPLAAAMRDGFVKEPAVATRKNFDSKSFDKDQLERLKLEDGITIHETTKAELEVYARQTGRPYVKPFMLVVAEDTSHAESIKNMIASDDFFHGRYKDRVITVHSKQKGSEQDEMVQKLLEVEKPENPVEVVIHVSKLQEGWDVTNLYTIVPLRAANSKTLVEQSIGRGLRLPYGKRTGVEAVDTLTIVSHDKFQEIVDHAKDPNSIIKRGIILGETVPLEGVRAVTIEPRFIPVPPIQAQTEGTPAPTLAEQKALEAAVKREFVKVIKDYQSKESSAVLLSPEVQSEIAAKIRTNLAPKQTQMPGFGPSVDIEAYVRETAPLYRQYAIDIPRIIVVPKGEVNAGFLDFDLDPPSAKWAPVDETILIQSLERENKRYLTASSLHEQRRLEDYLVLGLMDYDEVNYDKDAELLYKLSRQMVDYLRSYLKDDGEVKNVLLNYNAQLLDLIHAQMDKHYHDGGAEYEAKVSEGFIVLPDACGTIGTSEEPRNFRAPVSNPSEIRRMLFTGFAKCIYPSLKFDSDPERRFTIILEDDKSVVKWVRPPDKSIPIELKGNDRYDPDFIVEREEGAYVCEIKRRADLETDEVIEKSRAACVWCKNATTATGRTWQYVLIPHDAVSENMSFDGLLARFLAA